MALGGVFHAVQEFPLGQHVPIQLLHGSLRKRQRSGVKAEADRGRQRELDTSNDWVYYLMLIIVMNNSAINTGTINREALRPNKQMQL